MKITCNVPHHTAKDGIYLRGTADHREMKDSDDRYYTVGGRGEGIFRDRGSRFLSYAFPARSVEEFEHELALLRRAHHGARHHCWAYRLSPASGAYRYSDDGEPAGTAGRPIYEQLLSAGVYEAGVVVVRYFGGILLGTGGLHNAYKRAAAEALKNAGKVLHLVEQDLMILFGYEHLDRVMQVIDREKLKIREQEFSEKCRITVTLPLSDLSRIRERLERQEGVTTHVL